MTSVLPFRSLKLAFVLNRLPKSVLGDVCQTVPSIIVNQAEPSIIRFKMFRVICWMRASGPRGGT